MNSSILVTNVAACLLITLSASAAEILAPAPALERTGSARFVYRTGTRGTGAGTLTVRWTDSYGRIVEDRKIPVELTDESDIGFMLDLRRAMAMRNTIEAHLSFDGKDRKGNNDRREEDARLDFIAKPAASWRDYEIIMWQHHSPEAFRKLSRLGISGGQWNGKSVQLPGFLLDNNLRWYAENIATDFYSEYHRWFPDRPVNWRFNEAKELYRKDPANKEAFKRHPSLSDERWLRLIHDRLVEAARRYSPYRPFFYSLGDETGIADLAAFWDFDFSDESLVPMRQWLRERYGTLAALNREWGAHFSEWDLVTPMTTDEAMKQTDENYAAWADFKDWMDEAYARALKMGNDAIRSVDPDAYVSIGGGQMPGWGGYDYYRVSHALTAIEPYDIGNNIEIIRSINPAMAVVTTSFATGPWEKHRVWYELLHGNRGLIIWDDKNGFIEKSGDVGGRSRETEPYYTEIRNGIGAQLINSRRLSDPIAIHYSQASLRTEWMRERRLAGSPWSKRSSSTEDKDNEFLRVRESWRQLIEDLGLQYNFVAYRQVEEGELARGGYRVLILPRSSSLSAGEAQAIRRFAEQGGIVIADSMPGTSNEHSRKLERSPLADMFAAPSTDVGQGRAILFTGDILNYHQHRLVGKEGGVPDAMRQLLSTNGIRPEFAVAALDSKPTVGVETHVFENGGVRLIGLHSNPQLRVDELGPPEFKSNERFATARSLRLQLPAELNVYDVRAGRSLGRLRQVDVKLDPYEPAIYAVSPSPLAALDVRAPSRSRRGDTVQIALRSPDWSPAAVRAVRIDVTDAAGAPLPHYSGNVLVENGAAGKVLPIAYNDPPGNWRLRIRDVLTGVVTERIIAVE